MDGSSGTSSDGRGVPRRRVLATAAALAGGILAAPPRTARAADGGFDTAPAAAAIRRLLPDHHRQITLTALDDAARDRYRVTGSRGAITVAGTTPAVLLTALGAYLRTTARADLSWTGEQLGLPARLPAPDAPITAESSVPHRFALNDTNDGYTAPYRPWDGPHGWEHTLDLYALHGFNAVLTGVGTDAVYRDTFREFGYSDAELRAWIPGPAHQPWWLLQNMSGFGGPVSEQLLADRAALGRRIADRLREFGMTPVLPGYFGTVPDGFADRNDGAATVPQGNWGEFKRPDWLDPRTAAFGRVAASFYRHQQQILGDTGMVKMDLLHEGGNAGSVDVGAAAQAVEKALRTARPGAVWAILGWQSNPRKDILEAVDRTKMLIVDGLSDRYPTVTDRESDWDSTPYAFGSIWNFGGHTALGANTPDWVRLFPAWRDRPKSALAGIAAMPEGSDNNPAALDLLTALPWTPDSIDLGDWFDGYADARYGGHDPHARAAWQVLRTTAYGMSRADNWSEAPDGLFGARPGLTAASAAAYSPQQTRYDITAFDAALTHLLAVAPPRRASSAYRYDLAEVARQALSNRSRLLLPELKAAYDAGDRGRFDELAALWLDLMDRLDTLLGASAFHLLGRWTAEARAAAADAAEADRLEYDVRTVITVWGTRASADGGLADYANREWHGLVGTLYKQRWKLLLDEVSAALREDRPVKDIDWYPVEDAWTRRTDRLATEPSGDLHALASAVRDFLAADAHQAVLAVSADRKVLTAGQPATATVVLTNRNGFAAARNAVLRMAPPAGLTAEPLDPVTAPTLAPGAKLTARFRLTLDAAGDDPVVRVPAAAEFRAPGGTGSSAGALRLLAGGPVPAGYSTATWNDAAFAASADGSRIAIEGGGSDLWGGTNQFGTVYLPGGLPDGASATVLVSAQDATGGWARAGLIVRNDLAKDGAPGYLDLAVTPANGVVLSSDANGDGKLDTVVSGGPSGAPVHLRLTRSGTRVTAERSADGKTWTAAGTAEVAVSAAPDVGVFMSAVNGGSGARGIAEFQGFSAG